MFLRASEANTGDKENRKKWRKPYQEIDNKEKKYEKQNRQKWDNGTIKIKRTRRNPFQNWLAT